MGNQPGKTPPISSRSSQKAEKESKEVAKQHDVEYLARETRIGREQVEKMTDLFAKYADKQGQITKENFRTILKEKVGSEHSTLIAAVFNVFDANASKSIDLREFVLALHLLTNPTPDQAIDICFRSIDLNNDGNITKGEMKEMALLGAKLKKRVGALMTKSFDGVSLTIPEVSEVNARAEKMFEMMDVDKSRGVSKEEFAAAMKSNPELASYIQSIIMNDDIRGIFTK
eukprot:TRINITY_DN3103_c0_g1_i1.p1 TRINITY_DN3103_c0_g1~~TRINITY_DN3103_c0_g1_i1.p1  ORF type:complete len:229 (-),score=85.67 TRINITY_DN3103_c0_g1_i1:40-726(-)